MRAYWQLRSLFPGSQVGGMIALTAALWLLDGLGRMAGWFVLTDWLLFDRAAVWRGEIWRVVTFPWQPTGIVDLLFTAVTLFFLGTSVERAWRRGELWSYMLLNALLVAGLWTLMPMDSPAFYGFSPVAGSLLIAWAMAAGNQPVNMLGVGECSPRTLAWVLGIVMFVLALTTGGLMFALVLASGALSGWGYLRVRWHWLKSCTPQQQVSTRGSKLEL